MPNKFRFSPNVKFILKWKCTTDELVESLKDVEDYEDVKKVLEENMIVEYLPRPRKKEKT